MRKRDSIKVLLGSNIRTFRKKKGLTQAEFASELSCDLKYIGDVENGWYYPSSELLIQIVDCLDLSVSELFTDYSVSKNGEKKTDKQDKEKEVPAN
ncbi:MAG: helix-turn-helix transcriptional regulator [Sphaerochaetaceae bacterium]|nr:helix-turn-helix transcriptional regulator [Sphaerochaetaceae bacterium]